MQQNEPRDKHYVLPSGIKVIGISLVQMYYDGRYFLKYQELVSDKIDFILFEKVTPYALSSNK